MKNINLTTYIISVTAIAITLSACQEKKAPRNGVTGKGNGGNILVMSKGEVQSRLENIKEPLKLIFQALKYMEESEELAPGSTDLSEFPDVKNAIKKMFSDAVKMSVIEDIDSDNNIELLNEPCVDDRGVENLAAAKPGDIGGSVCFSITEFRLISPKGSEVAVDILVLATASHEFGHHYFESTDEVGREAEEEILRNLQAFVSYQLNKYDGMTQLGESVVTSSGFPYIDRLLSHQKKINEQIKDSVSFSQGEESL